MPIQIEIDDSHVKQLTEFYILKLKTLRDEILEREKEIKQINTTIQTLRKASQVQDGTPTTEKRTDYSEKWQWLKKVEFAIETAGKPLTTKEIVDVLSEYETTFIYDRKKAIGSVSSILSTKWGDDKEFIRTQSESGDFEYNINKRESEPALKEEEQEEEESPFRSKDDLPF